MEKEVLFERLYDLLKDTHEWGFPEQEAGLREILESSVLLNRWRDLCLELGGATAEEFREWARQTGRVP